MSDVSRAEAEPVGLLRPLLVLICIVLVAASMVRYRADQQERLPAAAFLQTFDVTVRRPAEADTLPLVPQADLTANLVAAIALDDALGTVDLRDVTPEVRERWLRATERLDEELTAARAMTVEALAVRPGWPVHWSMLGKLAFAIQRRQLFIGPAHDARQWQLPLATALRQAPGDDSAAAFLSAATLETWPDRTALERDAAVPLFRRALLDGGFAVSAFPQVIDAMGRERAVELLPDKAVTLRAAFAALADGDDIQVAELLYRRWEAAEWRERQAGVLEIEERARLNDVERLRDLTLDWMQRHPPSDFDTAAGRAQALRVLQLAVNDRIGPWRNDPRASVVRFFLTDRMDPRGGGTGIETAPGGLAVGNAAVALTGMPEPDRARTRLLAGDIYGAETLFQRSDSAGAFEWTPFLIDLARYRLTQRMPETAGAAIESMAPAAREECDALIVRREIGRTEGHVPADVQGRLNMSTAGPRVWSPSGTLSLCIDPDDATIRHLTTRFDSARPALVSWGWNEGRRATVLLPAGRSTLEVPMTGHSGHTTFFVRTLAGGPAKPIDSAVE